MNLYRWPYKDEVVVLPQFLLVAIDHMGYVNLKFCLQGRYDVCRLCDGFNGGNLFPYGKLLMRYPCFWSHASVHIHFITSTRHPEPRDNQGSCCLTLAGTLLVHTSSGLAMIDSPGCTRRRVFDIEAGTLASSRWRYFIRRITAWSRPWEFSEGREISKAQADYIWLDLLSETAETTITITDLSKFSALRLSWVGFWADYARVFRSHF
jgi:hypothetical protein